MNMQMVPLGGKGGKPWQGQIQTIAPRVRNNYASAPACASYRLDSHVLDAVGNYSSDIDDLSVLSGLRSSGIEADLRDVIFARALL